MATRGPKPTGIVFTDENVLAFEKPVAGSPLVYRDLAIKGLILRVSKGGVRSYALETRDASGGKGNTPLGYAGKDTLESVRKAAVNASNKKDAEVRSSKAQAKGESFAEVFERYITDKKITPRNRRAYLAHLMTYAHPFWDKPLAKVTRDQVQRHRQAVRDGDFEKPAGSRASGGPDAANKLIQYGSMIATWLLGRQADHAFRWHDPYVTPDPKEAFAIEPTDWPRIADVVGRWASDDRDLFWTHVMLGARPLGTSRMRWDLLDLDAGTYRLTKDRALSEGWKPAQSPAWDYPLDSSTIKRLSIRKALAAEDAVYVFPSPQQRATGGPITPSVLARLFGELREALNLPDRATPIATRKTRATYSDALFGRSFITAVMLNHQLDYGQSQTKKYVAVGKVQTWGHEQVRRCVEEYSQAIEQLAGIQPMTEVVRNAFFGKPAAQGIEGVTLSDFSDFTPLDEAA